MKKITCLLVLLLVFSCFCVTVQAQETLDLSEDYRTVDWNGSKYLRFDASGVVLDMDDLPWKAALTDWQLQSMDNIEVTVYNGGMVLELGISFSDGAYLSVFYLREDMMADYTAILSGQAEECRIDFFWPEGNVVQIRQSSLQGSPIDLDADVLEWCDNYDVILSTGESGLQIITGTVLYCEGRFYYVDFGMNNIRYEEDFFYPGDYSSLSGWEITDTVLLDQMRGALNTSYSDGLGFLDNDSLTKAISRVFMVIMFGVLPGIILVMFLILSLRAAKPVYRVLFRIVWILALALLVVFILLIMTLW